MAQTLCSVPGLALTDGYMELKRILDNPAFEEMLAVIMACQSRESDILS